MLNRTLHTLSALLAGFSGATCAGEQVPAGTDAARVLETIEVVGTRTDDIPGKSVLLDASIVQAVRATHPAELFARVPGTWISRGGGQEQLTALRSPVWTGAGACGEVVYAEDGVPVRPSGFCNANQLMEINGEQAGGVEVLRGTQGGAFYGANAVHGVINVLSLPLSSAAEKQRSSVSLEAGPNDYSRALWTQRMEEGYLALQASHDGGYQDSTGYDQQKISWKHQQQLSDVRLKHYLTATDLHQQSGAYLEGADAYKDDSRKQDNSSPDAYRDAEAFRYVQSWDWQQDDYRYSIKPYVRHSDMDFSQHFNPGQPLEKNGHNSVGMQALMQRDNFLWGAWHSGAEMETAQAWTHEWQTLPTTAGPLVKASPQGEHYDYDVGMHTAALWQALTLHVTPQLDAQAGARADRIVYEYDNHLPANSVGKYTRPADRGDSFTLVSPRVGLVYTDHFANEWYASLSSGKRAPQTAELYRLQGGQTVAGIGEESLDAGEIGWRGSNRWQTQWSLALFDMHKDHVIIRNAAKVLSDDAKTQHRGIEINISQQWDAGWFASAVAAYAEHRYNSDVFDASSSIDGNIMDTAPRAFGAAQFGWQQAGTRVEMEWQHMGPYYLSPEDTFEYEGHDLLNLRAAYAVDSQWTLFARLMNATNVDYAERADVTVNPNPALVQPRYFVGQPRSLYVGFEWSY